MKIDTKALIAKSEKNLKEELEALRLLVFPQVNEVLDFRVDDEVYKLEPKAIQKQKLLPPRGNQVIYILRFIDQFQTAEDLEFLRKEAQQVKQKDHDGHRQVTGIKDKNWEYQLKNLKNVTLYTGSSKAFPSRLREHIGWANKGTATLLLRKWPSLMNRRFKVTFNYFDFGPEIGSAAIKYIEYHMANELRPLIGHNRIA